MKKIFSLLSLAGLMLLPACCCKKDRMKDQSAQEKPKCDFKKKDAAKKDAAKKDAPKKKQATKGKDAQKDKDTKKKYSLVNPAASKSPRAQFQEVPQLPLV